MTNSLFAKMMIIFIIIIAGTTVLSMAIETYLVSNETITATESAMRDQAVEINSLAKLKDQGSMTSADLLSQLVVKADLNEEVIWLVDNDRIYVTSNSNNTELTQDDILKYYGDMYEDIRQGNVSTNISRASDTFFNVPVITVGAPISIDGNVKGAVFIHKTLLSVNQSLYSVNRVLLITGLIYAVVAVLLCTIFSSYLLRPLKRLSNMTKELAKGNFDVRVKVSSHDEVGQLAETFNQAAEDLERYEATRSSFIASVSHELRSPMTSMQGLVQAMLDGTIKDDQRDYYLNVVLGETKRLSILINDLLDLTRMESGTFPMDIKKIDINEIIRRTVITFENRIRKEKIDVDIEMSDGRCMVMGDKDRMAQVMVNLIDNAVKFTPEGGKLAVRVAEEGKTVKVSVINSGKPIAEEELPLVFVRFYKTDKSRNREQEGTGLGLSIVKKIIEQHGQKIWVTSSEEEGTTFTFTLQKCDS